MVARMLDSLPTSLWKSPGAERSEQSERSRSERRER